MEQELITLGILFFFALVGGILAARFKQPMLMGLLLVGALIGPNMLGLIHNENAMDMMIEFGAVLILFVLGLEFDIQRLKKLGLKPIILATLNVGFMTFAGFVVSILLGFDVKTAFFLGLILSFGSTVIIAKVLENKKMMEREEVPLIIAVLIIDDIIAVMIVTFLSGIEDKSIGLMGSIENLFVSIAILLLSYVIFVKFIKPILSKILVKYTDEEIKIFAALALWAGFAYLAYYLKLSPAVGAFMAGSIITSLPNTRGLKEAIEPYNLIISSFFFIAIGTLISFQAIAKEIVLILILVAIVIIVKLTAYSTITYLFANMRGDKMFFLSIATFAVGEFSLLIAKESMKFGIQIDLISIAAAVISISAVIMSLTITYSDRIYQPTIERVPWKTRRKIEKFSEDIKTISEELDLDNKYTQSLKKVISKSLINILLLLLTIFGYRKISTTLNLSNTLSSTLYGLAILMTAILLFYLIINLKNVLKLLAEIFDNATNTRSIHESKRIVKKIIIGSIALFAALFWPFVMFLINTNPAYIFVSVVLLGVSIFQLYSIGRQTHTTNDSYRNTIVKYSTFKANSDHANSNKKIDSKTFNRGWEI
jgi:CPA2 family monovalent cation:H+ antiporter-2